MKAVKTRNWPKRIELERQERGLTVADVASGLRVHPATIRRWEKGVATPDIDDAIGLAKTYKMTVDNLFVGRDLTDLQI